MEYRVCTVARENQYFLPWTHGELMPTNVPNEFQIRGSKRVHYQYFANQSELDEWKAARVAPGYRVAVGKLKGDQKALADAAAGNPGIEREVATILTAIENTRVMSNIPVLQYFLNEQFGSICAKWGTAFFNKIVNDTRLVLSTPLHLEYKGGTYNNQEHFIVLLGVGGKVFGVDQEFYGKADNIFDINDALNDENLKKTSREALQKAVQKLLNQMQN